MKGNMYVRVCQHEEGVRNWCIDYCINPAYEPDSCTRFLGPVSVEISPDATKLSESTELAGIKKIAEFYGLNIEGRENEAVCSVERRVGGSWYCLSDDDDIETASEYFLYGSQDGAVIRQPLKV